MALPRLLAVGEGLSPTGYARVMESVLEPLSRVFEVTLFAINAHGAAASRPPRSFAVRGNSLPGDRFGVEQLGPLLEELDPDVVLLHGNSSFHLMHRETLAAYRARRPGARVVVYCPADWPEQVPAVTASLAAVDLLVMYTPHGLETVSRAFTAAGLGLPPTAVIPHGVDCSRFAPMHRAEARERLFGSARLDDAFIVLNANRSQRRKRIDLTLQAFAAFASDRPDAWLYLHMGMRDLGGDVLGMADSLGIAGRLLTTTREAAHPRVPDEQLRLIYNACDVGLNTASAEGWGLVSFEHACTGAVQVVPAGAACASLWEGAGLVTAPERAADALAKLYDNPELRASLGRRCLELARSPEFRWEAIAARWSEVLLASVRSSSDAVGDPRRAEAPAA